MSQQLLLPLNHSYSRQIERSVISRDKLFHSSIKPFLQSEVENVSEFSEIWDFDIPAKDTTQTWSKRLWYNIKYRDIFPFSKGKYYVAINPLIDFGLGRDNFSNTTYHGTRGIQLKANLGKKVSIESKFYENNTLFPDYQSRLVARDTVVPGQGYPRGTPGSGLDYAFSEAYISYSPVKEFNLVFGHGKNFIGDGYRSMLLSDHAFHYPFLKLSMNVWKVKYTVIYNQMLHPNFIPVVRQLQVHPKKFSTIHYLSWDIKKRFQIGIFEAIVWDNGDSTTTRGYELAYLNPILFLRPEEFSLRSPDNAALGLNLNFKITDRILAYGQVMIDDLSINKTAELGRGFVGNKVGGQLGAKFYDLFGIERLFLQAEYNVARPFTYGHKKVSQNFSHYNHPLTHPLGANFHEIVGIASYNKKRFYLNYKLTYAIYGEDVNGEHNGSNIFISDFAIPGYPNIAGQHVGQGLKTDLVNMDLSLQYIINPVINLRFEVAYSLNVRNNDIQTYTSHWFTLNLATRLDNFYFDF
ncbi:MAG: hypothetical protein HKN92_05670 [Chitinophagales bacterium]|nr:hypothetical protein [Chitinophagales bacterium]